MYGLTDNELEKLCNLFRKHEEIEQVFCTAHEPKEISSHIPTWYHADGKRAYTQHLKLPFL